MEHNRESTTTPAFSKTQQYIHTKGAGCHRHAVVTVFRSVSHREQTMGKLEDNFACASPLLRV